MNKHQRQSRQPADRTTLPDDVASELSPIATEVIDVGDAPPIAPRAPLTQDEIADEDLEDHIVQWPALLPKRARLKKRPKA